MYRESGHLCQLVDLPGTYFRCWRAVLRLPRGGVRLPARLGSDL